MNRRKRTYHIRSKRLSRVHYEVADQIDARMAMELAKRALDDTAMLIMMLEAGCTLAECRAALLRGGVQ